LGHPVEITYTDSAIDYYPVEQPRSGRSNGMEMRMTA